MEGKGMLRGHVVDDANVPIELATVAIQGTEIHAITAPDGSFVLVNAEPGAATLLVHKIGYIASAKILEVIADHELDVLLILVPFLFEQRFADTRGPYNGFLHCGVSMPGVIGYYPSVSYECGNVGTGEIPPPARNEFLFDLSSHSYHSIVGETQWQWEATSAHRLQTLFSHVGGGGNHWWCAAQGTSPIQFVYSVDPQRNSCVSRGTDDGDAFPVTQMTLNLRTFLPFIDPIDPRDAPEPPLMDVAVMQTYESIATVFYGDPPPQDYTAFSE